MTNTIYQGDALAVLKTLPDCSVQCCVTSPPYFGLRDYGIDGQIGLEATPGEYVEKLVQVFREVKRVLRNDGTCWLNLGDSFSTGEIKQTGRRDGAGNNTYHGQAKQYTRTNRQFHDMPPAKNLLGMPWRVAFALQDDGWILRQDIIWHKPTAMPESVTDRPTSAHEHIFLLVKSERYFYDADAIAEPTLVGANGSSFMKGKTAARTDRQGKSEYDFKPTRNKRNVWTVSSQPYAEAHFATMPPKLVEPCILAGSRPGDIVIDPFLGAGTVAMVALQHNRRYIGIDLNPEYIELARKRIATIQPVLWSLAEEVSA